MAWVTVASLLLFMRISEADVNKNIKESNLLEAKSIEVFQRKLKSIVVKASGTDKSDCLTVDYSGVIVTAQRPNTINPKEG